VEITRLDELAQLDEVRDDWEAAYAADANAHVFVSWRWLRAWIDSARPRWLALAARAPGAERYRAFFIFRTRAQRSGRFHVQRELYLGGRPHADYTGFVCAPEIEAEALTAAADFVRQRLAWDSLRLEEVMDPRLDRFLAAVRGRADLTMSEPVSCPYIALPETWDAYEQSCLSAKARKHLRYYTRKVEGLDGFQATVAGPETVDAHLDALLTFWQARWNRETDGYRRLLRACFDRGGLWLGGLWQADAPIALLAAFPDESRQVFAYFMSGFNPAYADLSPGKVMVAHSLRYAVEHGYQTFDFLRGDEGYKFSFGAAERFTQTARLERRSSRNALWDIVSGWAGRAPAAGNAR
jgi:CelD/BcsL family acetyltransferase involved in cellulose biosynthesis